MSFIPINKPLMGEEEKSAVMGVVSSGRLTDSSYEGGRVVKDLEGKISRLLGAKHVIAVNSGTAALHCALLALNVKPGDEVIVPTFTFVATANVVLACGAKPVFVDNRDDYNVDPAKVAAAITRKTKAVIPVHLYGYPADMDEIRELAEKKSVRVVEDAAESLGAAYKGKQTGTLSDVGCFSLYATKVVTSGEGGALSTDDDELADRLRMVRNHGMVHGYDTRYLGYNYRLPEVMAAIGAAQMDKLEGFIDKRRANAKYLMERFSNLQGAEFTQDAADRTHVFYLYTLSLKKNRDLVAKRLVEKGVGAAVYFKTPVHKTPMYVRLGYSKKKLPAADRTSRRALSLPVHPGVTKPDLERVASEFIAAMKQYS
ncbi:MAG TPA: DegT/DnrJ/EryC1/StrS family aminotransferase [Nitrososphaerales archaeon]|nr:DegT/DnrJ/EryC1/StrS family aminotransferase [Nitrososphaerales archaeon]